MVETLKNSAASSLAAEDSDTSRLRPGVIYIRTMQDNRVGILAWGLGYSVLIVVVVMLFPILEGNNTLLSVLNGLGLFEAISQSYAFDVGALATFPGYLAFEALGWAPTILAIYMIPQALGAVMGEEKRGTLDLLLSTPISRSRLLIEKMLAVFTSLVMILVIMWIVLVFSTAIAPGVDLTVGQASAGVWHILPISAVITGVALVLSVTLRNPRTAASLMALFVIVSFFMRSLADLTQAPLLLFLRRFSVYSYYSSLETMVEGVQWSKDIGVLMVAILCCAVSLLFFQRRDLHA